MKLSLVFLCLSLVTLSLAAISSAKKKGSLSRSKQAKKDGATSRAASQSSQAPKRRPVEGGKKVLKKRLKKKVGASKGVKKTSVGAAQDDRNKFALSFFPKVLVELIGGYLEGSFSVVLERKWSAVYSWYSVAVDNERHYLITRQDVQVSSHGDGVQMNIGDPDLSDYDGFQSSHDGRSLLLTGKSQEQVSRSSSENTTRWLIQDTGTKGLKSVTLESGETSFAGYRFMLSANGKTLLSTFGNWTSGTQTTSVYQIEEHRKADIASKKGDFDGYARAVSGNGNRILLMCEEKEQFEIHDISGDKSQLVLEISYAGAKSIGSCALNNDGSKAAFIVDKRKLYIVDVDKQKGSTSVSQLTPIDIPGSFLRYSLIYDAKDRLYAFIAGNLWLVDPSENKLVSLEKAVVPQGCEIQSSAISPNGDYIALLLQSKDKNKKGKYQYQMIVKRKEVTKKALMRLYRHGF